MRETKLLFFLIMILCLVFPQPSFAKDTKVVGKIVDISGTVNVKKGGKKTFDAFENMSFTQGDTISTGKKSKAVLHVDSNKEVTVSANTKLVVKQLVSNIKDKSGKSSFNLSGGKIKVKVNEKLKGDSKFQVQTPNAIMGVMGTEFAVAYDGQKTYLAVFKGVVRVDSPQQEPIDVYPNQFLQMNADGSVEVRTLGPAELAFFNAESDLSSIPTITVAGQTNNTDIRYNPFVDSGNDGDRSSGFGASTGSGGSTENTNTSDTGGDTENPNEPDTGGNTDIPNEPDTGGNIEIPNEPDTGENTDIPNEPDTGGNTDIPNEPDTGGNTDIPNEPDTGGNTDIPSEPDTGGNTDIPKEPDTGGNTEIPNEPDTGGNTDIPNEPDTGGNTDIPSEPDTGGNTDIPNEPDTGGNTDIPTEPDTGGNTEIPTTPDSGGVIINPTDPEAGQDSEAPTNPNGDTITPAPEQSDFEQGFASAREAVMNEMYTNSYIEGFESALLEEFATALAESREHAQNENFHNLNYEAFFNNGYNRGMYDAYTDFGLSPTLSAAELDFIKGQIEFENSIDQELTQQLDHQYANGFVAGELKAQKVALTSDVQDFIYLQYYAQILKEYEQQNYYIGYEQGYNAAMTRLNN